MGQLHYYTADKTDEAAFNRLIRNNQQISILRGKSKVQNYEYSHYRVCVCECACEEMGGE